MLTNYVLRKRAQRAYPKLNACERCGSTLGLQRHHPSRDDALTVVILCQACHAQEHVVRGTWGRGTKKMKTCVVCEKGFSEYSHSRVKTCGTICLSKLGRQNAYKRWGKEGTELEPSEMP